MHFWEQFWSAPMFWNAFFEEIDFWTSQKLDSYFTDSEQVKNLLALCIVIFTCKLLIY